MPVDPINNYAATGASQGKLKKANSGEQDDDARRAALVAASQEAAKERDDVDKTVKKVVEVQKKEGMSEARRSIDKFA